MRFPDDLILLFARAPRAGKVKTRLIPTLGEEGALDLYRQMLDRQIDLVRRDPLCPAELWVDTEPEHEAFAAFRGALRLQAEGDLGLRMAVAAADALGRARHIVLIGCDCPDLDRAYLERALAELEEGAEVVLGPARDGGYVLLGLRRPRPFLFQGVGWGGARVLAQTLEAAREAGLEPVLLDTVTDIDRPQDLGELSRHGIYPRVSRPWLAGD